MRPETYGRGLAPITGVVLMIGVVVTLSVAVAYTVMGIPGSPDDGGTAMTSHVEFTEQPLDPGPHGADGPQVSGSSGVAVEIRYSAGDGYDLDDVEFTDGQGRDLLVYVGTGRGGPPYEAVSEGGGRFSPGSSVRVSCVDTGGASCRPLRPGDDVVIRHSGNLVASYQVQGM